MPLTSMQMSGLIGGQQAMFSNQAAFAQQLAGMGQINSGMTNPYPAASSFAAPGWDQMSGLGAQAAGGAGMALPGMLSGAAMTGGLMGGAAGWADPFTASARFFARGAGFGGQGAGATLSGIGRTFAAGGMRAGMGAIGGGLAAAALPAAAMYAGYKGVEAVGQHVYEGAQNIQDIQGMTQQYMAPRFGQAGGGSGGQMGRGAIKNIAGFLHEMANEDVMSSMKDMRNLMDQAGRMGMLSGIGSVQEFKTKFKGLVNQAKGIAEVLGTSVQEAMPFLGSMRQMGLWSANDVMGTALNAKSVGAASTPAMMGTMQQGAQISRAAGGRMGAGAMFGQQMFGMVNQARQSGTMSEAQLMEMTGGVGGAEGMGMAASGMQQAFSNLMSSPMGNLMAAGLGGIEGGAVTGKVDAKLLEKFKSGGMGVGGLMESAQRMRGSKNLATGFSRRSGQIGQEILEKGGPEAQAQALRAVIEKAGYGGQGEDIQKRFLEMMTGADTRTTDVMYQMMQDLPRLQMESARKAEATLRDSVQKLEYRRTRSFQGLKDAAGQLTEKFWEPVVKFGENLTTNLGDQGDRIQNWITGRTQGSGAPSDQLRMRVAGQGGLSGAPLKLSNVGQSWVDPGAMGNMTLRMQEGGFLGRLGAGMAGGGLVGAATPLPGGAMMGGLAGGIGELTGVGEGVTPRARMMMEAGLKTFKGGGGPDDVALGGGQFAKTADLRNMAERAIRRGTNATLENLKPGGNAVEKAKDLEIVKTEMTKLFSQAGSSFELREAKESGNQQKYQNLLIKKLREGPAGSAIDRLGTSGEDVKDTLAMAQSSARLGEHELAVDYARDARDQDGMVFSGEEEKNNAETAAIDQLKGALGGAKLGFLPSLAFHAVGGGVGGVMGYLSSSMGRETVSDSEMREMMRGEEFTMSDVQKYIEGKGGVTNAFSLSAGGKNTGANKLRKQIDEALRSGKGVDEIKKGVSEMSAVQAGGAALSIKEELKAKSKSDVGEIEGLGASAKGLLAQTRADFSKGEIGARSEESLKALSKGELRKLAQSGSIAGQQLSREAAFANIGEGEEGFKKFQEQLAESGLKVGGEVGRELEKLGEDGISKSDKARFRELGKMVTGGLAGKGPGGAAQDPFMQQMTSFVNANRDFVNAVGQALGKDLKTDAVQKAVAAGTNVVENPGRAGKDTGR